ncbi:MAG: hypothetical protein JST93_18175 [Acidobacteria bacterium]|nr:hypothetical protein [Acidobacteriota bacterium]
MPLLHWTLAFALAAITFEWRRDAVEIHGVPDPSSVRDLASQFRVSVAGKDIAIPGAYDVSGNTVRFRPRFPLQDGLTYEAHWGATTNTHTIPKIVRTPSTSVAQIYPTSSTLPANQLKLYLHFSASMSRGEAWRRIHLIDDAGKEVSLPFLEIEEELWDREARRLTVLFDPGRIKRGLVPHNEVGPALVEGRQYKIVIDREWPDATGTPLTAAFTKTFTVTPADRTPPTLTNWRIQTGTSLTVDIPEPMDSALLQRLIWIVDPKGERVDGDIRLANEETRWIFTPSTSWAPGKYQLIVGTILEDLAGNRIDRPFDVDSFERVEMRLTTKTKSIPFTVPSAATPK